MTKYRKKIVGKPSPRSDNQAAITAERRDRVSQLYRQNYAQHEIAKLLGVQRETITEDLKAIRAEWRESRLHNMDELVAEQLARIDLIELEAWEQWERSKRNARAVIKTTEDVGGIENTTTRRETRGQCGDARYLDVILKCRKQRADLLGLEAPKKSEVTVHEPPATREKLTGLILELRQRAKLN